jgi:hypothetical protein
MSLGLVAEFFRSLEWDLLIGEFNQAKLHFPADGYFVRDKLDPINSSWERFRMGTFSSGGYRSLTSPDLLNVRVAGA